VPIPYDTIEKVSDVNIPAWSETWPGLDGCGTRYVQDNEHSVGCPSSSKLYYEPVQITEAKDTRKISGRSGGDVIPFHMTPRNVSKTIYRQYLVRINHGNYGISVYHQHGDVHKVNNTCTAVLSSTEQIGPATVEWREVSRDFPYTTYWVNTMDATTISTVSTQLQQAAALAALSSFDLLTEVAEAREIPKLFS